MGERHQIFIVAKRGNRYRTLAVIHHQWLYGKTALELCLRLLTIFANPANRLAIEQELAFSVIDNDQVKDNANKCDRGAPHPFPFIATCLYIGTVADPNRGRLSSRVYAESPSMLYDGGDNNTGITVIDITDLDHLQYCYVWFEGGATDKPEPAGTYLRRFYDIDAHPESLESEYREILETLENKFKLIPLATLRACWPHGTWAPDDKVAQAGQAEQAVSEEAQSSKAPSKSLLSMSVQKLVDELLSSGDDADISLLDQPLESPTMKEALFKYCRENPDKIAKSTSSTVAVKILTVLLDGKEQVDLSPYHQMASDAMRCLLKGLKDIRVLNLSGTRAASDDEIADTLAAIGHDLDELYILSRPDRTADDPTPAARAIGKTGFKYGRVVLGCALSKPLGQRCWMGCDDGPETKPMLGPALIPSSQDLYGLPALFSVIQMLVEFPGEMRPVSHQAFFLGDGFFTPLRFVTGLLNMLRGKIVESWPQKVGTSLAHALALAPPSLKTISTIEINGPPAEAYWIGKTAESSGGLGGFHCHVRDFAPDAWTAVVIQESPGKILQFKVGLLRSKRTIQAVTGLKLSPEDVEVVDLETFLAKTSPTDVADLKQALEKMNGYMDQFRPGRKPDEQVVLAMDVGEALGVVEGVLSEVDKKDLTRSKPYAGRPF